MKKVLASTLAAAMLLGMATTATAADAAFPNYSQDDISKSSANLIRVGFDNGSGQWFDDDEFEYLDDVAVVNDEDAAENVPIKFDGSGGPGDSLMFIWVANDTTSKTYNQKATKQLVSRWDLEVETKGTNDVLRDINIDYTSSGEAIITGDFAPYLDSVKGEKFDVDFWLTSEEKKVRGAEYTIQGTYANKAVEIYEDDEDIDMTEGAGLLLEIEETVREASLELDYGIEATMRLLKGKDIYLRVSDEMTEEDFDLIDEYEEIEQVYHTYSVNAKAESTKIQLDEDDYYVYTLEDGELVYVDESSEELPLLDHYYLASSKLDLNYDVDEPDVDEDEDDDDDDTPPPPPVDDYDPVELPPLDDYASNPNGGPSNQAGNNANYNPSTGR
jgi:hypothetical protein